MIDPRHAALGRLPSGVSILTIGRDTDATGILVSWVQQAAFEPPMVSLALAATRPIVARIEAKEPFVLNVVGEGQKGLLKHFARGFAPGEPAFEGIAVTPAACGAASLAEAVAAIECQCDASIDAGDHRLMLARVTSGAVRSETPPMVHLRKRGDHY